MGTVWPVTGTEWSLNASDGELIVRTGVTGRAAKMGHRLTIAMTSWQLSCEADVRQTDFGVKPYSMLMGAMKVVDTVTVDFTAVHGRDA
jgi:hypothetical protein